MKPAIKQPTTAPLRHSERLSQAEFHRRYEAYSDDTKFELIGGQYDARDPFRRADRAPGRCRASGGLSWR
jgi:hypothetical protein